jgi:hypothetical protein
MGKARRAVPTIYRQSLSGMVGTLRFAHYGSRNHHVVITREGG